MNGEDVTSNILTIKDIPHYIDQKYKDYKLKFVVKSIMLFMIFMKWNDNLEESDKNLLIQEMLLLEH
nr:hypothetical protein [Ureaplasma parvum]